MITDQEDNEPCRVGELTGNGWKRDDGPGWGCLGWALSVLMAGLMILAAWRPL